MPLHALPSRALSRRESQLHYYEMGRRSSGVMQSQAHDVAAERRLLRSLAVGGVIGWFPPPPARLLLERRQSAGGNLSARTTSCALDRTPGPRSRVSKPGSHVQ